LKDLSLFPCWAGSCDSSGRAGTLRLRESDRGKGSPGSSRKWWEHPRGTQGSWGSGAAGCLGTAGLAHPRAAAQGLWAALPVPKQAHPLYRTGVNNARGDGVSIPRRGFGVGAAGRWWHSIPRAQWDAWRGQAVPSEHP